MVSLFYFHGIKKSISLCHSEIFHKYFKLSENQNRNYPKNTFYFILYITSDQLKNYTDRDDSNDSVLLLACSTDSYITAFN